MGCSESKVDEQTKEIDKQLKDDKKKAKYEVKLLLLGSGESGEISHSFSSRLSFHLLFPPKCKDMK